MQIILIRHAQSKGNDTNTVQGKSDHGLSELGIKQAKELSKYFQIGDLTAIYSSHLSRAVQTAEHTAKKLNLKINVNADLQEADFGIWEGLTYNGVREIHPKEYSDWHKNYFIRPNWFESFDSHLKRVRRAVEMILVNHKLNERVAVFTHGGSIKTQIGYFNKLTGEELASFTTANCSLTLIKFNNSKKYAEGELIYYNKEIIKSKA